MARTDWGMVILGGGALVGIAYVFFNWKTICPQVLGAEQCAGGLPGLFGGTITGSGMAQGYGQILTSTNPTTGKTSTQTIRTNTPTTGAKSSVGAGTSISKSGSKTIPKLNASGSISVGAGARYTDFNSFATITLNRVSVK